MGFRESARARVDAPPQAVFGVVTSIERLPGWNHAVTEVVEAPARLEAGAVSRVRIRALGQSWVSKSTGVAFEPREGRFAHRSQSDDGNPSYADWEWHVEADGDATLVTMTADLNPRTFWRKHLLVRIRRPGLRKEMPGLTRGLGSAAAG